MKKLLLIILLVFLLAPTLLFIPGVRRVVLGPLENFVRVQIEQVAADYLRPKLTIGGLRYAFPKTVYVTDLKLVQDDVALIDIPSGSITIRSIPLSSGQVRFQKIYMDTPKFRFVVNKNGSLVGWGNLFKTSEDRETEGRGDVKLSNYFAIEEIAVTDATVQYQDLRAGEQKMMIDKFALAINAEKSQKADANTSAEADNPNRPTMPTGKSWYQITTKIDRDPLLAIDVDARLNIDTGDLVFGALDIDARLARDNDSILPPQVQTFVQKYDIAGELELNVAGTLQSDDPLGGPLNIDVELSEATIGSDGNLLKVQSIIGKGGLRDDLLTFDQIEGDILGGKLHADFELLLDDRIASKTARPKTDADTPAVVAPREKIIGNQAFSIACGLQLEDVYLQELLTKASANERLTGTLNLDVEASGIVSEWPRTLQGDGAIDITEGQLASIPIISALGRAIGAVLLQPEHNDQFSSDFELRPDGVVLEQFSLISGLMAARGRGVIRFNNTLEMIVNGGPMERIQKSLGALGRALGNLTDRIVRYRVTGSLESPSVRIRPLGINTRDPTAPPPPDSE